MAFSLSFHCINTNSDKSRPNPTNSPIIVEDFQGLVVPPHCNARRTQQIAEIRTIAPKMSMCSILTLSGRDRSLSSSPLSLRKDNTRKKTGPPTGTLLEAPQLRVLVKSGMIYVHPKAPSPANIACKSATQDRSEACCQAEYADYYAQVYRSSREWDRVSYDTQSSLEQPRCANPCDSSANDEHWRISSGRADNGADC